MTELMYLRFVVTSHHAIIRLSRSRAPRGNAGRSAPRCLEGAGASGSSFDAAVEKINLDNKLVMLRSSEASRPLDNQRIFGVGEVLAIGSLRDSSLRSEWQFEIGSGLVSTPSVERARKSLTNCHSRAGGNPHAQTEDGYPPSRA